MADGAGSIDRLDGLLIELLAAEPRVGVLEASRRLGVARGTVQARLDRLHARGVVTGYGPDVDPVALGHRVTAFVTVEIRQAGGHEGQPDHDPSDHASHAATSCTPRLSTSVRSTSRSSLSVVDLSARPPA